MKTIYKYPLSISDRVGIQMPAGAAVLAVQVQRGQPFLWAEVDTDNPLIGRMFRLYGTGHHMDDAEEWPYYIGTFQLLEGELVYHVFSNRVEEGKDRTE